MKSRQKGTLSNFFVEIIIVILFFSLASIILSKIFVSSAYNNKINRLQTMSINSASSILEVYKSVNNLEDCLNEVLGSACNYEKDKNCYNIILNEDMNYDKNGTIYLYIKEDIKKAKAGINKTLNIKYIYNNREIYVIEGKKYEKK